MLQNSIIITNTFVSGTFRLSIKDEYLRSRFTTNPDLYTIHSPQVLLFRIVIAKWKKKIKTEFLVIAFDSRTHHWQREVPWVLWTVPCEVQAHPCPLLLAAIIVDDDDAWLTIYDDEHYSAQCCWMFCLMLFFDELLLCISCNTLLSLRFQVSRMIRTSLLLRTFCSPRTSRPVNKIKHT